MGYVTGPTTRTVQVLSATEVADVERVPFVTTPSGVSGWRYVPYQAFIAEGVDTWIGPLAQAIEDLFSGGLASYATMIEDIDPTTNLLADYLQVTVSYTPPRGGYTSTTSVDIPVNLLTLDTGFFGVLATGSSGATLQSPAAMLGAAYDRLVQTAGL
jgi:hypothetical protein